VKLNIKTRRAGEAANRRCGRKARLSHRHRLRWDAPSIRARGPGQGRGGRTQADRHMQRHL